MRPSAETSHAAATRREATRLRRPAEQDHDLPILAVEENPRPRLDWEALLASGVQPALLLGAERRLQNRR